MEIAETMLTHEYANLRSQMTLSSMKCERILIPRFPMIVDDNIVEPIGWFCFYNALIP